MLNPQVYVACLASYNSGKLYGAWIDADQDADSLQGEIDKLLENSPAEDAEEWAVHDTEDFFNLIGEYSNAEDISGWAALLREYGEAIALFHNMQCDDLDEIVDSFQEAYAGEWRSLDDFVYEIVDETMEIPEHVQPYFDYEAFQRDLFIGNYWEEQASDGNHHVFRSC